MEDAVQQLDSLARVIGDCTHCQELVACRLRAVPGGGHPHCAVMVVSLSAGAADELDVRPAGSAVADGLADYMPALRTSADEVYVTALTKCVPRTAGAERPPATNELDACFPFFSKELTITTPHYVLTVGEKTTRYLLAKLFRDPPHGPDDSLELRVFDNPAFRIVPIATPEELRDRNAKACKDYRDKLRALATVIGL